MIPSWITSWIVMVVAALLITGGVFAYGWSKGSKHIQAKWDIQNQVVAEEIIKQKERQSEIAIKAVTKYVDRIKIVKVNKIKEVPVYVNKVSDDNCIIPVGFLRVHNTPIPSSLSIPPGVANETPSGVKLSTVASTISDNYSSCQENSEQLKSLQEWVTGVHQLSLKGK